MEPGSYTDKEAPDECCSMVPWSLSPPKGLQEKVAFGSLASFSKLQGNEEIAAVKIHGTLPGSDMVPGGCLPMLPDLCCSTLHPCFE